MRCDLGPFQIVVLLCVFTAASLVAIPLSAKQSPDLIHQPYQLNTGLVSRSISFENPTGRPAKAGKRPVRWALVARACPRKRSNRVQTMQLCDIQGPGTIRHIWLTTHHHPAALRGLVLRAWWEGQQHPSIECPVGDFFGTAQGKIMPYCSAVHSVGQSAGMNLWLPMPFSKRVKFDFTNETEKPVPLSTRSPTRWGTSTRRTWADCTRCSAARTPRR